MKGPDGFVQAYNVQVAVDELQLIVGQAVTQETNDKKQLMPMITTIAQQSGDTPPQLLADAGYCSDANLTAIADTDHRRVHLDAEAETWRAAGALSARPPAEDRDDRRPDVPQAAHEDRRGRLCGAQRDRRTGDWPDQAGAGLPAIPVARIREGARGMVAGVHDAQHSQAVSPLRLMAEPGLARRARARAGHPRGHRRERRPTLLGAQHEGTVTITAITRTDS